MRFKPGRCALVAMAVLLPVLVHNGRRVVPPAAAGPAQGPPDLSLAPPDRRGVAGDWQTLAINGTVVVTMANHVAVDVSVPCDTVLFEDRDGDGRFGAAADRVLGRSGVDGLAAGATRRLDIAVAGEVVFRDNLIYALADPEDRIAEQDEANNLVHSGQACRFHPPVGSLNPRLEWEWTGSTVVPRSNQVIAPPVVIDLDGDGVPEIVFASFPPDATDASAHADDGNLRAIHGDGTGQLFTVTDRSLDLRPNIGVAAGDIDGDGRPEILGIHESSTSVLAFEHDGRLKWRSEAIQPQHVGGPAIADLDHDGVPEIVVGATVLNRDGTVRWTVPAAGSPYGRAWSAHTYPLAADLDLAGDLEVMAGRTAFRAGGSVYWHNADVTDGTNAVGNFDDDPYPEIVLVTESKVYLLEHDGAVKWGPTVLPGGTARNFGGPPTVADMDGDGQPEIGVAGGSRYTVFETDGSVKWSQPTQDTTSHRTGSTVFDFEGDGAAEVVYGDERMLRIYAGRDGRVLWQTPSSSATQVELPVIADVDADGNAEIVKVSNDFHMGAQHGVQVFGDADDNWVGTRGIWNQHTYHINNVNDDGTIPRQERPSWLDHNTYRLNLPTLLPATAAPDLTASRLEVDATGYPARVVVRARIGNGGATVAPVGTWVAFYDGAPGAGARLVGRTALPRRLAPGEWVDLGVEWANPAGTAWEVHVVADDDGRGAGNVNECDETNNHHWWTLVIPATATPSPTLTPTPTSSPTATLSASPTRPPAVGPCLCPLVRIKVPRQVIEHAMANPERYGGWNRLMTENKPGAPPFPTPGHDRPPNPRRTCLDLQNPNVPWHPVLNTVLWRAVCASAEPEPQVGWGVVEGAERDLFGGASPASGSTTTGGPGVSSRQRFGVQ